MVEGRVVTGDSRKGHTLPFETVRCVTLRGQYHPFHSPVLSCPPLFQNQDGPLCYKGGTPGTSPTHLLVHPLRSLEYSFRRGPDTCVRG